MPAGGPAFTREGANKQGDQFLGSTSTPHHCVHLPQVLPRIEKGDLAETAPTCSDAERWPRRKAVPRFVNARLDPVLFLDLAVLLLIAAAALQIYKRQSGVRRGREGPPCRKLFTLAGLAGAGYWHFRLMASTPPNLRLVWIVRSSTNAGARPMPAILKRLAPVENRQKRRLSAHRLCTA